MSPELKEQIEQRERVFQQVAELLISALKLDRTSEEIDPDTPLFGTGLGLDSVDAVEIIVDLESEFGISLDESEGRVALRTINSLVDLVLDRENIAQTSCLPRGDGALPNLTEELPR
jgi:acyl carrier protein